jgi:hypothetical protein
MFYLHSLGGIAVISDQRRATERVRHEPMLNFSIPAKETYRDPKQRIHNQTERHTHILQMLSMLAFTADTNLLFTSQSYNTIHCPQSDMTSF